MDLRKPRQGSRAFRPRKRAKSQVARMKWPTTSESRVLGFAGYKAGMATVAYLDQSEGPTKGQEIVGGATILEVPPIYVYGIRGYKNKRISNEMLVNDESKLKLLGIKKTKKIELNDNNDDIRILVFTQPQNTLIGKKHPERFELGLGGNNVKEKLELAKKLLGKEIRAKDVFKSGEIIDVIAISKGKGWQGAVKRFGVHKQRPKATGKRRHVGTLGQWHPNYVLYTVPQAGQMGYHKRTEFNKTILKVSEKNDEAKLLNPKDGFSHFGLVKNDFIIIKGSVPGPVKRLIKMRLAMRMKERTYKEIKLTYLSTSTQPLSIQK